MGERAIAVAYLTAGAAALAHAMHLALDADAVLETPAGLFGLLAFLLLREGDDRW